jgi:uncharacterized protein YdeI (YjbR/CyaY-like superfamily)
MGAFRDNYRLNFMNAELMKDPEGILQTQGENSQTASSIFFTDPGAVAAMAPTIRAYLAEAKGYAERGILPEKKVAELPDLAPELIEAMDDDPDLAEAFHALTPGRQRSWNLHFTGARQSATVVNRIAKARDKIIAGKGWNER